MAKVQHSFKWTDDRLVRILRSVSAEPLDGFIAAHGSKWLLLRVVDDSGSFDGYSLVRNAHITEVQDRGPTARFVRRLLEIHDQWPPTGPSFPLDLDRTAGLVASLSDQGSAVGLYIEEEDPDVMFVGVPFFYQRKKLGLHEIDASGRWRKEASQWEHRRLTRIDFGCRYTTHVLEVAERCAAEDDAADQTS